MNASYSRIHQNRYIVISLVAVSCQKHHFLNLSPYKSPEKKTTTFKETTDEV